MRASSRYFIKAGTATSLRACPAIFGCDAPYEWAFSGASKRHDVPRRQYDVPTTAVYPPGVCLCSAASLVRGMPATGACTSVACPARIRSCHGSACLGVACGLRTVPVLVQERMQLVYPVLRHPLPFTANLNQRDK